MGKTKEKEVKKTKNQFPFLLPGRLRPSFSFLKREKPHAHTK
jgi:hypothetical protein